MGSFLSLSFGIGGVSGVSGVSGDLVGGMTFDTGGFWAICSCLFTISGDSFWVKQVDSGGDKTSGEGVICFRNCLLRLSVIWSHPRVHDICFGYQLLQLRLSLSIACIGEGDHSLKGGQLYIQSAPPSFILILHNRWKINILVLQGGRAPPCHLGSFAHVCLYVRLTLLRSCTRTCWPM